MVRKFWKLAPHRKKYVLCLRSIQYYFRQREARIHDHAVFRVEMTACPTTTKCGRFAAKWLKKSGLIFQNQCQVMQRNNILRILYKLNRVKNIFDMFVIIVTTKWLLWTNRLANGLQMLKKELSSRGMKICTLLAKLVLTRGNLSAITRKFSTRGLCVCAGVLTL